LFLLPDSGPSGAFSNGSRVLNVLTNANGLAVASAFTPNGTAGRFVINVNASFQGRVGVIAIHQTNLASAATAGGAGVAGASGGGAAGAGGATGVGATTGISVGRGILERVSAGRWTNCDVGPRHSDHSGDGLAAE
jgi:hypothetical protein